MYVYIKSEPSLWTVGFYSPDGEWHPDSDHSSTDEAAERVNWLNGGAQSAAERTAAASEIAQLRVERDAALSKADGYLRDLDVRNSTLGRLHGAAAEFSRILAG